MDKELERYLESVESYLRRMPTSERIDIIKELKSTMEELQRVESLSAAEVLQRLGPAKQLATGYLGEKIQAEPRFSWKKLSMMFAFYSLTFFQGMFIIPCGSVLAGALIFSGVISPIAGLIKLVGYILGFEVPFVVIQFGPFIPHPVIAFFLSILFGLFFLWSGRGLWRMVLAYIRKVSETKDRLGI